MAAKKTAPEAEVSPSGYWDVTVSRKVSDVFGANFHPGPVHTVNDAVLEALGDAVLTKTPHVEPV
ncbi:hypothetical protein [Methylopila sp. 73B]|uniref:hypothetical protein n=1 Tax=Methylopila sp. 73B TaxID=1120792 RepID=UPI00036066D7|nr:hypothetical protein [Methylopila sp. 73B]